MVQTMSKVADDIPGRTCTVYMQRVFECVIERGKREAITLHSHTHTHTEREIDREREREMENESRGSVRGGK